MLENLKEGYSQRAVGYYASVVSTLLGLILSVIYVTSYVKTSDVTAEISWISFAALIALFVVNSGLFLIGKQEFTPIVSFVLSLVALCFFVLGVYHYVSVVIVGIDVQTYSNAFIINTTLFVVLFLLSIVNMFLPQSKEA